MKTIRLIGLAALAALALAASLGSASASAASTTLCKTSTYSPYCKAEERYPAGTALQAFSSNVKLELSSGKAEWPTVECSESYLAGETGSAAEPLGVQLSEWTLEGCTLGGSGNCHVEEALEVPGTIAWTSGDNGTLSVSNVSWNVSCGANLNCNYALPHPTLQGGSPASIVASKQSLTITGGYLCSTEAKFSATYSVSSPKPAYVAKAESPPSIGVVLCKTEENTVCQEADRYPSGTMIEGEASNLRIESYPMAMSCKEASFTAKTLAAKGTPLPIEITSVPLSECEIPSYSSKCSVTTSNLSSKGMAIGGSKGDGQLSVHADWYAKCGSSINCTFHWENDFTAFHGSHYPEPASLLENESFIERTKGSFCPFETSHLTVKFSINTPKSVFVREGY